MTINCHHCGLQMAIAEPKLTITTEEGDQLFFHNNHYTTFMKFSNEFLKKLLTESKIPSSIAADNFSTISGGRKIFAAVIDYLIGIQYPRPEALIELLEPWYNFAAKRLAMTLNLADGLKQEIDSYSQKKIVEARKRPPATSALAPKPARKLFQPPEPKFLQEFQFQSNSQLEKAIKVLPLILANMTAIAQKAIEIVFDTSIDTASTDCKSIVNINPYFFEIDMPDLGFGISYHEAGHIRYSENVTAAIAKANSQGDKVLATIINLIVDRHDDFLNAKDSPGFADCIWQRLQHILPKYHCQDPFSDFFYACKKRTAPRFSESHKAMQLIAKFLRRNIWQSEALYETAEKVKKILSAHLPPNELVQSCSIMVKLMAYAQAISQGPNLSPAQKQRLEKVLSQIIKRGRDAEIKKLRKLLTRPSGAGSKLPAHNKNIRKTTVKKIQSNNRESYQGIFALIRSHVAKLRSRLNNIESPVESEIRFQEEGELDMSNLGRLVLGFKDCFTQTIVETEIDTEIHLVIDQSGSMHGDKIEQARQICVLFNEAILAKKNLLDGHIWGYHDNNQSLVYDYGRCRANLDLSSMTAPELAGNNDPEALSHVASSIIKSKRKKKLIIMIGDDGPANPWVTNRLANQLLSIGIPVIHIMVEVAASPKYFPIELLFRSFSELIEEFGEMLTKMLRWMR